MRSFINNYVHAFLDVFYPRICLHCRGNINYSREQYICGACRENIAFINENYCSRCGSISGPYSVSFDEKGCGFCRTQHFYHDSLTAIAHYDGAIKVLVHKYKYEKQRFLYKAVNDVLLANRKLNERIQEVDIIIPVPLYWRKKLQRGFNQSELIAREIHRVFSKPLSVNNLIRIKNTASQTRLSKTKRYANIQKAFFVKNPAIIKGKRVLLVDDVLTTGLTMQECAKKLKEGGVKSVHLLVLAIADYKS
ncbi:MAG: ComF family protein [Planctomycetes bacterium]|nr:ComF family protein [Planctomycetota bacterium]